MILSLDKTDEQIEEEALASEIYLECVTNSQVTTLLTGTVAFYGVGEDEDHVICLDDVPERLREGIAAFREDSYPERQTFVSLRWRHFNLIIVPDCQVFMMWVLATEAFLATRGNCPAFFGAARLDKGMRATFFSRIFDKELGYADRFCGGEDCHDPSRLPF